MDTNTYLLENSRIDIDKFYIEIKLFRWWDDDDPLTSYGIDIHIWWKLWCLWKTKDVWESVVVAKTKFDELVSIAKEIKNALE